MAKKKAKKKSPLRKLTSKIKSPEALARILKANRGKTGPVVFTNGCFDLLHKGHVSYLEKARQQGGALVVALNNDESVKRLKGPERPLNPLEDRLEVMAALESVDYVTWFSDDTPLSAILKIRPDILVKGGDWALDQIVGGKEVISWGGKVKSLNFIEGRSTTQIIERARKR